MVLSIFDNIFIVCSILEAIRRHFGALHDVIHIYAFAYFMYQLQAMAFVSSIFTTVVLAVERYMAVTKPLLHHHNIIQVQESHNNTWRRVFYYIGPVILLSIAFNTPKYFEIDVVDREMKVSV